MKRFLAALCTIYLLIVFPAQALSISGGTQEQQDAIREAIQAAEYPTWTWTDQYYQGVSVEIVEHFPPYWEVGEPLMFDVLPGAIGAAWFGEIRIMSTLVVSPWLTEVAIHEWAHEVWFALPPSANAEWRDLVAEGFPYDPAIWRQSPPEAHAEHLRVYGWEPHWYVTAEPRTDLRQLTAEQVFDFHARWIPDMTTTTTLPPTTSTTAPPPPPTTTTTTTPRGDPFLDVAREDTELWEAAWWARDSNVILGYPDGTFRPYDTLMKHHLDLIVDRWVGIAIGGYGDYTPATRGYLWLVLPGLRWDSTRMDEPLLRSQLLRLIYRGRQ